MNRIPKIFDIQKTCGFHLHHGLIYSLAYGSEARNIVEIGTGMSTKALVAASEDLSKRGITSKVWSHDQRRIEDTGLSTIFKLDHKDSFGYIQGKTEETLRGISFPIDFCLHDGTHVASEVKQDLQLIVPKMKQGAALCIHDVDFESEKEDIRRFSRSVVDEMNQMEEYEKIILPYGYGLAIYVISKDRGNGKISVEWKKN